MLFLDLKKRFFNKRVLILGLGKSGGGTGNAKFFCRLGAKVKITDKKTKKELKNQLKKLPANTYLSLGGHKLKDFLETDFILKNPAVPWDIAELRSARKAGVEILTDSQLFFEFCPREKIIGVTGTKGKTTICYLLKHILSKHYKILLTGNIFEHSPLLDLLKTPEYNFIIYELSSFSLESLKKSPRIAILANIFPDHMDRYKSFNDYASVKRNIVRFQTRNDFAVFPEGRSKIFENWEKHIKSTAVYYKNFSLPKKICEKLGAFISPSSFGAALAACRILKISQKESLIRLKTFKPETGRLEIVGKKNGVMIVNDSMATNPGATAFAISQLSKIYKIPLLKIILIAGGIDKGLNNRDYKNLTEKIEKIKALILLPGNAGEKIVSGIKNTKFKIFNTTSLKGAWEQSLKLAQKDDVILFSPAGASFNLFRNAYERNKEFLKLSNPSINKLR